MTKNSDLKARARQHAREQGITYTAALRDLTQASPQPMSQPASPGPSIVDRVEGSPGSGAQWLLVMKAGGVGPSSLVLSGNTGQGSILVGQTDSDFRLDSGTARASLAGFVADPESVAITITPDTFERAPGRAVGAYPLLRHSDGAWKVWRVPVAEVWTRGATVAPAPEGTVAADAQPGSDAGEYTRGVSDFGPIAIDDFDDDWCRASTWGHQHQYPHSRPVLAHHLFGPGRYNRCVLPADGHSEHLDGWGHRFVVRMAGDRPYPKVTGMAAPLPAVTGVASDKG